MKTPGRSRWTARRSALIVLNVGGYLLLARLAAGNVNLEQVGRHIQTLSWHWIIYPALVYVCALVMYGKRMAMMLRSPFGAGFFMVNVGYALNSILPFRLGEGLKILATHRVHKLSLITLFSAAVTERLADATKLMMLGLLLLLLAFEAVINVSVLVACGLAAAIFVGCVLLIRSRIVKIIRWLPKRWGRLRKVCIELHKHFNGYPLLAIALLTLGIGFANVMFFYLAVTRSFPTVPFGLFDAISLFLILAFAVALPSAPASVGLFEGATVAYLKTRLGIPADEALAFALILHVAIVLPPIIFAVSQHLLYVLTTARLRTRIVEGVGENVLK